MCVVSGCPSRHGPDSYWLLLCADGVYCWGLQAHNLDTAAVLSRGYLISSCVTTQLTHNHEQAKVLLEQLSDECLKVSGPIRTLT